MQGCVRMDCGCVDAGMLGWTIMCCVNCSQFFFQYGELITTVTQPDKL